MTEHKIKIIGETEEEVALVTCQTLNGLCHITLQYGRQTIKEAATDYFEAFCLVRSQLEKENLTPFCYGASLNVQPYCMIHRCDDTSAGTKAYRLTIGRQIDPENDLVDIFSQADDVIPASLTKQNEYFREWCNSIDQLRKERSGPKPSWRKPKHYQNIIDTLVRMCREGQVQISSRQAREESLSRVASGFFLRQVQIDSSRQAREGLLKRLSAEDRDLLVGMLRDQVELGVFETLKTLEVFQMPPFQDGYKGSPLYDFVDRLDGWEWPKHVLEFESADSSVQDKSVPSRPIDAYKQIIDQLVKESPSRGLHMYCNTMGKEHMDKFVRSLSAAQSAVLTDMLNEERSTAIYDVLAVLSWWNICHELAFTYHGQDMPVSLTDNDGLHGDYLERLDGYEWPDDAG
jgi:hypothetical protein